MVDTRLALVAAGIVTMSDSEIDARLDALSMLALDGGPVRTPTGLTAGLVYTSPSGRPIRWDPEKHPRHPRGHKLGGKFALKYGDAVVTPEGTGTVTAIDPVEGEVEVLLDGPPTVTAPSEIEEFNPFEVAEAELVGRADLAEMIERHDRAVLTLAEMGPEQGMWDPYSTVRSELRWEVHTTQRSIEGFKEQTEEAYRD